MARVLRNSYHWPCSSPPSERSNARCVSIQQGSAVHRCACFINLPLWLRSQLEYSKHHYFIESSNEPDSDANSDTYPDTYPHANPDPDSNTYTDSNAHADTYTDSEYAWASGVGT